MSALAAPPAVFPVPAAATPSWVSGMGQFGHSRASGTRRHAGGDVYAPVGSPVVAMRPGTVTGVSSTYYRSAKSRPYVGAVTVQHADGSVYRYCEVQTPLLVRVGQTVEAGEIIARIGDLHLAGVPDMLHFEAYSGTIDGRPATGPLTVGAAQSLVHPGSRVPYLRRKDLVDPTRILNEAWAGRAPALPTLREGSTGEHVARLQQALILSGDLRIAKPTGVFAKMTTAAVKAYQTRKGLDPDGVAGRAVWTALDGDGL